MINDSLSMEDTISYKILDEHTSFLNISTARGDTAKGAADRFDDARRVMALGEQHLEWCSAVFLN